MSCFGTTAYENGSEVPPVLQYPNAKTWSPRSSIVCTRPRLGLPMIAVGVCTSTGGHEDGQVATTFVDLWVEPSVLQDAARPEP
jgi:hypothetical protein